jgi:single-strand DNA-binding protein
MARSLNRVELIGNLGQDPDIKSFPDGGMIVNISVATTSTFKDRNGEQQDRTEWHRVVMRGYNAQNAEKYLHKGSKVFIEGELQTRSYEDRDGNTRYITEIFCRSFIMLDSRQDSDGGYQGGGGGGAPSQYNDNQSSGNQGGASKPQTSPADNLADDDDDIPF